MTYNPQFNIRYRTWKIFRTKKSAPASIKEQIFNPVIILIYSIISAGISSIAFTLTDFTNSSAPSDCN
jgi:hypothetical protein